MRGLLLLGAAICGAQASIYTITNVDTTENVVCSTAYGSGGTAPTPVPVSNAYRTTSTVYTSPTVTIGSGYSVIHAPTVTVTDHTYTSVTVILATMYSGISTVWSQTVSTVATANIPQTTCINGINPKTVTKYTGTYAPKPGQSTSTQKYATKLFCTTATTSYIHLLPTVMTGVETTTVTSTYTVNQPTTTVTRTITYLTLTSPTATVTSSTTTYVEASSQVPTNVACSNTVTKTLDARCAPTNLVGNHNNSGVTIAGYHGDASVVYTDASPYGSDPSQCCQLCLDNQGCGASVWFNDGECGLFYRTDAGAGPQCSAIFDYEELPGSLPGQNYILAEGCGTFTYNQIHT
ncbi:hypothetical protein F5Y17DRAFT_157751 [Xylariaceae sp. FL0594]|nr:hypothetical protein F5Y17DRAFT_157751 [Xylariaceae sp. FL0594]